MSVRLGLLYIQWWADGALNRKEMFNISIRHNWVVPIGGYLFNVNGNSDGIPSCILQWKEMLSWK